MATWLNHVAIAAPRNGTTTHTVDPNSGTVIDGSPFITTTGRMLLCIVEGGVTSTTPSGWTLPSGGSAVNETGLYVWWAVALGGDTFSTTHNDPDYPVMFNIYEFGAGSSFVSAAAATGVTNGGTGPSLSSLTGTNHLYAAMGSYSNDTSDTGFTCSWGAGVEEVETSVVGLVAGTAGYVYSDAVNGDSTSSTWSSAATFSLNAPPAAGHERLVFAVNISTDGGPSVTLRPTVVVP